VATYRITIRIDPTVRRELEERASAKKKGQSEIVREALKEYFTAHPAAQTCYDAAVRAGVVGIVNTVPFDMSINRRYFKGFGRRSG
jgi:predicted transcriptional regulator